MQDLIQEALQRRPEIAQARINLTNLEVSRKSIRNTLLPTLDVYAFYGASGLAGEQNPVVPICPPGGAPTVIRRARSPPTMAAHSPTCSTARAPDKGIGVNLNIPLRNRAAQANQERSGLEYRQAQVALQQTENTISLQVRQAQFAMQQNYAALQAAIAARDYASESLIAEQKKFTYGASTPTLVLQASSNLTQGESNVLNAAANYEKSRVNLEFTTAETLDKMGIDLSDAEAGNVKHMPTVQGVLPTDSKDVLGPRSATPEPNPAASQPAAPIAPAPQEQQAPPQP